MWLSLVSPSLSKIDGSRKPEQFPIIFACFLKSLNSKFCNFRANLNCECRHTLSATVVKNCLIYCAGCILQAHSRSRPAWVHHLHGPPNEIWVLLGSDALPWNTFFPRELWRSLICCSGIFLLMELPWLWIANQGNCSSPSLLQHAPVEHLPPGLAW